MNRIIKEKLYFYSLNYSIFIILITLIFHTSLQAQWKQATPLPQSRSGFCAARIDHYVYIIGGSNAENEPMSSILRYDLDRNTWDTSVPEMHHQRANAAVVAVGRSLIVMGGRNNEEALNSVEKYSIDQNKWTELEKMKHRREAPAAAVLNGKLYVFGGRDENHMGSSFAVPQIESYEFTTNQWNIVHNHNMIYPRFGAQAISHAGKIYVLGGFYFSPVSIVESFEPSSGMQEVESLQLPRALFAMATDNDTIFILGGRAISGILSQNEAYVLNSQNSARNIPSPLDPPRYDFSAISYKNKIFVFGGLTTEEDNATNLVQYWEPIISGVEESPAVAPSGFRLFPGYPNPFSSISNISYSINPDGFHNSIVSVQIFNTLGQRVRTLVKQAQQTGMHTIQWNGLDDQGHFLPNGVYLCRLITNQTFRQQKLILAR